MSAEEIIAELPKLAPEDLRLVKAKVEELEERALPPKESVWDVMLDFAGKAEGLPADMAENHDYYLHGTAKRKP